MPKIAKQLTRQMLQAWGIINVHFDEKQDQWVVLRNWWGSGKRTANSKMHVYQLEERQLIRHHKYGRDMMYKGYSFSYMGKNITLPVARLVLAWTEEVVPEGYDACHKDGNECNNRPNNIYLDTHKNNLMERYDFYRKVYFNQYNNINKEHK